MYAAMLSRNAVSVIYYFWDIYDFPFFYNYKSCAIQHYQISKKASNFWKNSFKAKKFNEK